jgi:PEP-CTERM/exosortase A-associated glycosyltransferase
MRVLHVLDHSLPLHSGYAFRTTSLLREQRALGWETLQLTTPRHGRATADAEEVDGWLFHRTPFRAGILSRFPGGVYFEEMRASRRRIRELAQRHEVDVIHAHSPVLNALPALSAGRSLGLPVVYELRALWEDAAVDHGTTREGSLRYRVSRALETYALRRADRVATICEGLRREVIARGVDPEHVNVIPNAVDPEAFRFGAAPRAGLRRALGLDGATVLGFAGSFYAYEGLDLLISAAASLIGRRPELRVLLVGGGREEPALRSLASKLGLADRVIFAGRVPHDEVQDYYDLIDVLAYPRRRMRLTELVTPLKPLEAMAQGRMLVASDVGGHKELIRDGQTGFLFEAGDAEALARTIDKVLERRGEWEKTLRAARAFIETERTWSRSAAGYRDVYRALPRSARAAVHA